MCNLIAFSLLLEEDGLSPNCHLRSATYFSFAHCSLPRPVSVKDPGCERASHNGFFDDFKRSTIQLRLNSAV